jgi:hypothetical protein
LQTFSIEVVDRRGIVESMENKETGGGRVFMFTGDLDRLQLLDLTTCSDDRTLARRQHTCRVKPYSIIRGSKMAKLGGCMATG